MVQNEYEGVTITRVEQVAYKQGKSDQCFSLPLYEIQSKKITCNITGTFNSFINIQSSILFGHYTFIMPHSH